MRSLILFVEYMQVITQMVAGSNPAVVTLMLCVVPIDELRVLKLHCLRPHSRCSWEITCDGLVSHPLITLIRLAPRKPGVGASPMRLHGSKKDLTIFNLLLVKECNIRQFLSSCPVHSIRKTLLKKEREFKNIIQGFPKNILF